MMSKFLLFAIFFQNSPFVFEHIDCSNEN